MSDNNHYHFKIDLDAYNSKKKLSDELADILTDRNVLTETFEDIFYYGYCFAFEQCRNSLESSYKNARSFQEALLDIEKTFEGWER